MLATVEWTNWSRIGTSRLYPGAPLLRTTVIPFNYKDGWFFSGGAEYQWNEQLTLRAGVGYEKSPITDDVRIPLLPDNDRYWLSIGGTYKTDAEDHVRFRLFASVREGHADQRRGRQSVVHTVSPTSAVSTRTSTSSRSA